MLTLLLKEAAKNNKTYKAALLTALGTFLKEVELDALAAVLRIACLLTSVA